MSSLNWEKENQSCFLLMEGAAAAEKLIRRPNLFITEALLLYNSAQTPNRRAGPYNYHVKNSLKSRRALLYKMASTGDTQLFDESFTITNVDDSKYDRVARFAATSADSQTVMTLDINTELYPCQLGETLHCVLASSLSLDGTKDDGKGWRDVGRNVNGGEPTLADMFDYVCHGKIYKFEDGEDGQTM